MLNDGETKEKKRIAPNIDTLVLSSGGMAAMLAHVHVLSRMQSSEIIRLENINRVVGVSAGSIVGSLIAIGGNWCDMISKIESIARPHSSFPSASGTRLFSMYGLIDVQQYASERLAPIIAKRFNITTSAAESITMASLHVRTNVTLQIIATSLNTAGPIVFDHITTPQTPLLEAILASCAVPLICVPRTIRINGTDHMCVDGAMCDPCPTGYNQSGVILSEPISQESTIVLRVVHERMNISTVEGSNIVTYLKRLYVLVRKKMDTFNYNGLVLQTTVPLVSPTSTLDCATIADILTSVEKSVRDFSAAFVIEEQ